VARGIAGGAWRKGQGVECKCVMTRVQGGKRKKGILAVQGACQNEWAGGGGTRSN
jgi:hypothetical protein